MRFAYKVAIYMVTFLFCFGIMILQSQNGCVPMRNKLQQINWLLWLQGLLFVAAAVLIFHAIASIDVIARTIGNFISVISPVIVAAAFAYMLSRPVQWVEKWVKKSKYEIMVKRARGIAVLLVYVIVLLVLYVLLSFLLPLLIGNIMDFAAFVPDLFVEIQEVVYEVDWDWLDEIFNIEYALDNFFTDFDIQAIVGPVTQGIGVVTNFALGTALWIFDFMLALIISIYFLLSKDVIFATVGRIVNLVMKPGDKKTLSYYASQADDLFYKFIGAQFLDACIMGAGSILLLWALNVRFAVFLGILLGVANMIPKFGSIFASIVVIVLTFITGGVNQGLLTAVLLTVWQQIDGNIIGPKIMGDALKINPILIFFSLLIGAHYGGILGMFLAIPAMALVKIIIMNIVEAKETKQHHSDRVAIKIEENKIKDEERKLKDEERDRDREKMKADIKNKFKKPEST